MAKLTNIKQTKSPIDREDQKLAILEAQKAKEKIFKLVVKIICWESAAQSSAVLQSEDKITAEEWQRYKDHRLSIFNTPFWN